MCTQLNRFFAILVPPLHSVMSVCHFAGKQILQKMDVKNSFMSTLRHQRRPSSSPLTVSRSSDVVKDLPRCSAAPRRHDVGRQASEIERLVKLAEQIAADAQRRRQAPDKSTITRPMRQQTGDQCTQKQRPLNNVHGVIPVLVDRTSDAVSAMSSDSRRRRRRGIQSPLTLSQLIDVKSLERCPKCHKVRLDVSSKYRGVGPTHQSRNPAHGEYNHRSARVKVLVGDSPVTTTGHSRSRDIPIKATELLGVGTASTYTRSRGSTKFNQDLYRGQGQGHHTPACNTAGVVSTEGDDQQDVNNNYDCESGNRNGRSTWPRKAADCQLSDGSSSTSPRNARYPGSFRVRLPVWRKRPSLSAVQQMWKEQSMQRPTTGDGEVELNSNNSPPSAASSYDPLDTVSDTDGYRVYVFTFALTTQCRFYYIYVVLSTCRLVQRWLNETELNF